MNPSSTAPDSHWNETLSHLRQSLSNPSRWVLNCPQPKPKASFQFFSQSATPPESLRVTDVVTTFWGDVFSVLLTCLAAYFLQWLIHYFIQFCVSLGYILSGADAREPPSAPPSPPKTPSVVKPIEPPTDILVVRMNEPVNCSVLLPGSEKSSQQSLGPRSSRSSLEKDGSIRRAGAGSEYIFDELAKQQKDTMVTVYAAETKPSGSFDLEYGGLAEFVWLESSTESVAVTGSFLGFNLSFPLAFEDGYFRLKMNLPPGTHEYLFMPTPEEEQLFLDCQ